MRLYNLLCLYVEAKIREMDEERNQLPEREGNNFSTTELADQRQPTELDATDRPDFKRAGF